MAQQSALQLLMRHFASGTALENHLQQPAARCLHSVLCRASRSGKAGMPAMYKGVIKQERHACALTAFVFQPICQAMCHIKPCFCRQASKQVLKPCIIYKLCTSSSHSQQQLIFPVSIQDAGCLHAFVGTDNSARIGVHQHQPFGVSQHQSFGVSQHHHPHDSKTGYIIII